MLLSDTTLTSPDWLSSVVNAAATLYADKKLIDAQAQRMQVGAQPMVVPASPVATSMVQYAPQAYETRIPLPPVRTIVTIGGIAAAGVIAAMLLGGRRRGRR